MYTKNVHTRDGLGFAWIPVIIAAVSTAGTIGAAVISSKASQKQHQRELEMQEDIFREQLQAAQESQVREQQAVQQTASILTPALIGLGLVMLLR